MQVEALDALTPARPQQVALGFFDGLHLGHQRIIARTVERARSRGEESALFTFRDHPMRVLRPSYAPPVLTTFDEKVALLQASGIDRMIWREFTTAFSELTPAQFIHDELRGRMRANGAVTGPNYRFGHRAEGTVATLRTLADGEGMEVEIVEGVTIDGDLVSSTRIRTLVKSGAVTEAARLLGRSYGARALVVHGDGRGRTIGFPTANLAVQPDKLLPADGVYAVHLSVDGVSQRGVANLGVRPTFGQHQRVLEVHLLDYSGDLYGKTVEVGFAARLRGEMKFDSVGDLVAQIGRDAERAREQLAR